jgi:hypothetical protein
MNPIELARIRSGTMRWLILYAINIARPQGIYTEALLAIIQGTYPDATHLEIRRELDYLEERELVRISKDPLDRWFVDLQRYGIEVVEYTCPCDPGISRPTITQA